MSQGLKLPHVLLVLLHSAHVLKYGVHIKADFTQLFCDCGLQESMDDPPFVGAQELEAMAQDCQLADRANISLGELTSRFLQRLLPKDLSVRVSPAWDNPTLSDVQQEYAVHNVYAAWLLYEAFTAQVAHPDGRPITGSTPSGA